MKITKPNFGLAILLQGICLMTTITLVTCSSGDIKAVAVGEDKITVYV